MGSHSLETHAQEKVGWNHAGAPPSIHRLWRAGMTERLDSAHPALGQLFGYRLHQDSTKSTVFETFHHTQRGE